MKTLQLFPNCAVANSCSSYIVMQCCNLLQVASYVAHIQVCKCFRLFPIQFRTTTKTSSGATCRTHTLWGIAWPSLKWAGSVLCCTTCSSLAKCVCMYVCVSHMCADICVFLCQYVCLLGLLHANAQILEQSRSLYLLDSCQFHTL